jgi:transcriptional regulator NrdR family protein
MKCPTCGAWSSVISTRDGSRRRRECANEHRFTTDEVVIPEETLKQNSQNNIRAVNEKRMVAVRSRGRTPAGQATQTINQ